VTCDTTGQKRIIDIAKQDHGGIKPI
jgi:hypothetical protein